MSTAEMLEVNTKRKALVLVIFIVVAFGAAAAFVAWGVDAGAVAAAG